MIQEIVNKLQERLTSLCDKYQGGQDLTAAEAVELEYLKEQIQELETARVKEYRFNQKREALK